MSARKRAIKAPRSPAIDLPTDLAGLREEASQQIEKLIALLDRLDAPETDLEPDTDAEGDADDAEPSLGSVENHPNPFNSINQGDQTSWAAGRFVNCYDVDCEGDEHDGAEPDVDDEPSLGSFDRMVDQRKSWKVTEGTAWTVTDAEVDRSDREDDGTAEQSEQSAAGQSAAVQS